MSDDVKIVITKRERDLILAFGYPFPEIMSQLSPEKRYPARRAVVAPSFWWNQLVGDLARSLNHNQVSNRADYEDTEELFCKIENCLR